MAIKAPKWVERMKAVPTVSGWMVAKPKGKKGEIIKAAKFTPAQIAEWYAERSGAAPAKPVVQTLHEAPVVEKELTESEVEYHYGQEDVTEETEE